MTIDSKILNIVKYLAVELAVDLTNKTHLHYLIRAIKYADEDTYIAEPKHLKERISSEIFLAKAASYFRRKTCNPSDFKTIDNIRRHEDFLVTNLKAQLQRI